MPAIPVVLVIKQTFLSIQCVLHTRDSDSYSTAAQVRRDPAVRDRIPIHDGAAILTIVGRGRRASLEGEYWTNRHTTGACNCGFVRAPLWTTYREPARWRYRAERRSWRVEGSSFVNAFLRRWRCFPSLMRTA